MLWQIGVSAQSLTRKQIPSDELAYRRVVRADTRREAITKCLPDILSLNYDSDIRYVSVYCGRKDSESAWRLSPVQINRSTGWFRFNNR